MVHKSDDEPSANLSANTLVWFGAAVTLHHSRNTVVHLVRHAEVENPSGVIYGVLPGFGLSQLGRSQARQMAEKLSSLLPTKCLIYSSPLQRTRETTSILLEHLSQNKIAPENVVFDSRLIEARTGLDGLPRKPGPIRFLQRWLNANARAQREPPTDVALRMQQAIRDALTMAGDNHLVVVSHQFPIWMARVAFTHNLGQLGESKWARNAPWLFIKGRCELASVSSLYFHSNKLIKIEYWEPQKV